MSDDPYAGLGRVVGSASPRPKDPLLSRVEATTNASNASAASSQMNAAETGARLPFIPALSAADVRKTQAEAAKLEAEAAKRAKEGSAAEEAAGFEAAKLREDAMNALRKIREARALVSGYSTGLPGQVLSGLGGTDARNLRAKLGSIASDTMLGAMADLKKASATGSTGLGQIAVFEAKALRDKIDSIDQFTDADQLLNSLAAIERSFRRRYAIANQQDPDDPEVAKAYGIVLGGDKPPNEPPSGDLTGTEEEVRPPELRGLNSTVAAMLKKGIPAAEIRAYMNEVQPGLGDRTDANLEWYEEHYKQNPNSDLAPSLDLERYFRPKTGVARTVGSIAESPVGAGVIGAADTVTGGFLDEMSDDPELARAALSAVQRENPGAYLAGQIGGGVLGAAGMGGLTGIGAKYGIPALSAGKLAALEGGIYGAGSADSDSFADRGVGAAGGALIGGAGQKVLGAVGRGGANLVGGIRNKSAELLDKYNIPLTLGEMVGGGIGRTEQRVGQIPFFGEGVAARQQEGIEGFNRAAFDEGLSDIGETTGGEIGIKGIQIAKQKLGNFYKNLLDGKQFVPDQTFAANTNQTLTDIAALPDIGPVVVKDINKTVGDLLDPTRVMTGTDWQRGLRDLKAIGRKYNSADLGPALRDGIDGLVTEFNDLATRQAPDIADDLGRANAAYRKYSILKDAVRDPSHADLGYGVFAPETLMKQSSANAERFGGRGVSAEGKHPFFDLSEAGIDVLTPARKRNAALPYLLPASVTGAGFAASHLLQGERNKETGDIEGRDPVLSLGIGALLGGAASAPYSKLMQKYLQKRLVGPKSAAQRKTGDLMRLASNYVGGGATAPLIDLTFNGALPEPPDMNGEQDLIPLPAANFKASVAEAPAKEPLAVEADDEGFITLPDGTRVLVTQRR